MIIWSFKIYWLIDIMTYWIRTGLPLSMKQQINIHHTSWSALLQNTPSVLLHSLQFLLDWSPGLGHMPWAMVIATVQTGCGGCGNFTSYTTQSGKIENGTCCCLQFASETTHCQACSMRMPNAHTVPLPIIYMVAGEVSLITGSLVAW